MTSPAALPGLFAGLAPVLDNFGYLAVAGFVLLEDFGVPVPGETVLIAAAIYAGAGRLSVMGVGLVAVAAAVVGDNVAYALGRAAGRPLVSRFGRFVFLTDKRLGSAESWFARHGGKVVIVARFVEGLRQANGWIAGIAGIARMDWLRFLAYSSAGALLWVATWLTVGYVSGRHIDAVYSTISRSLLYILAGAAAILAVLLLRHVERRRRKPRDQDRAGQ
ncbi:MAG: DedA family protein [Streptosporangiaceae bacterium]